MNHSFYSGIGVTPIKKYPMGFIYEKGVYGQKTEYRTLESIRKSLRDPNCTGPEIVYTIAMDVGKTKHKKLLEDRMLLFGIVTYASGILGKEPIRSQGHIHSISSHSGWSPPEVYEIWEGEAIIYMQETANDNPGKCFAVYAQPGEVVIVPPNWAHATISANPEIPLTFGAWCDREYGFEYDEVQKHQGLAWYPVMDENLEIVWEHNNHYIYTDLIKKCPNSYKDFDINENIPIYQQFENNPERFQFVSKPYLKKKEWETFIP